MLGDVLGGKYRIERVVGRGGMGVVFAARHIELHQRVAVKVLLPDPSNTAEQIERFMREARSAVRLKSDNSVRVTDVGRLRSGMPFMVMELLEGADLAQLVDHATLPVTTAIDYVLQACEAIAEAHALGMVHRDIKPSNLFVTRRVHGVAVVKVLDFGLAKHQTLDADRGLTKSSALMGSPPYMSPEQMRATRDVDARTDIWSLGVTLYELVTGTLPFHAGTVAETCALVLTAPPAAFPPSVAGLPEDLWRVIERCLAKDPAERFQNVCELANALEPFAAPASRGSAERVASVFHASTMSSEPPPATSAAVAGITDTVTAAALDSTTRERKPRRLAFAIGGAIVGVAAVTSLILVVARKTESSERDMVNVAITSTIGSAVVSVADGAVSVAADAPSLEASDAGVATPPRPSSSSPRTGTTRPKLPPPDPKKNPAARF